MFESGWSRIQNILKKLNIPGNGRVRPINSGLALLCGLETDSTEKHATSPVQIGVPRFLYLAVVDGIKKR
jgi:hypothetical protein